MQVRFNHFQNRRKYLITKIAEEIYMNSKSPFQKKGKNSRVKSKIFMQDSFKVTRGLTQNINQRYTKKMNNTRSGAVTRTSFDSSALRLYDGS